MIPHPCPQCHRSLQLPDHMAGKQLRCPACFHVFTAPVALPPLEVVDELVPLAKAAIPEEPTLEPLGLIPIAPNPKVSWLEPTERRAKKKQRPQVISWTLQWGILLGSEALLLLMFVPLFILGAGSVFLTSTLAFLGVVYLLALCVGVGFLKRGYAQDPGGMQHLMMGLCGLVFGLLFLGGGVIAHLTLAQGTVYIDNFCPQEVHLELDGQPWQRHVKPNTTQQTMLRRGAYTLVVRSAVTNKELDRKTIEVSWTGVYILNVLGAQTYYKGTAFYSHGNIPPWEPREIVIRDSWFSVDVDHLFGPPPGTVPIQVRKGSPPSPNAASRTYLLRGGSLRGR